jgi:glutamyl-tRNA reductase
VHIAVVGLNHNTASVDVREKVAYTELRIEGALAKLRADGRIEESLILSTCNRTEIYSVFKPDRFEPDYLGRFLAESNDLAYSVLKPHLYELENKDVVRHLFRVVSGLDSMVVGENQIAAQAKEAYRLATSVRTNGPVLNKLFHVGFRVGKKVRTETGISAGSLSVSQVACDLAEKIFRHLSERTVLVVGAGENGEVTANNLKCRGVRNLVITNRTREKAEKLAKRLGAEVADFDDLSTWLSKVDIVISNTGSQEPVIRREQVATAVARRNAPLFMIDMAIPRDIEPTVDDLDMVFLYDMDALAKAVEKSRNRRSGEAHKANRIVAEQVEKFIDWCQGERAKPTIIELQERFDSIRREELDKLKDKLDPSQQAAVEAATRAMMNKMLHVPITSIRSATKKSDDAGRLIRTVRSILGLSEES